MSRLSNDAQVIAEAAAFLASTNGLQATAVADAAAVTAYSAHASGATAVTSNAATDLDTTAAALETLRDEVAAIRTQFNALLAALRAAGTLAT